MSDLKTERMLILAAEAEGHPYPWVLPARGGERPWNPLEDNGDALCLAAAINADVCINICFCEVVWVDMERSETFCTESDWGAGDVHSDVKMRHVRLAIVRMAGKVALRKSRRAAAAIGGAE